MSVVWQRSGPRGYGPSEDGSDMGFLDKVKEQVTKAVDQHGDKIADGIDKAAGTPTRRPAASTPTRSRRPRQGQGRARQARRQERRDLEAPELTAPDNPGSDRSERAGGADEPAPPGRPQRPMPAGEHTPRGGLRTCAATADEKADDDVPDPRRPTPSRAIGRASPGETPDVAGTQPVRSRLTEVPEEALVPTSRRTSGPRGVRPSDSAVPRTGRSTRRRAGSHVARRRAVDDDG